MTCPIKGKFSALLAAPEHDTVQMLSASRWGVRLTVGRTLLNLRQRDKLLIPQDALLRWSFLFAARQKHSVLTASESLLRCSPCDLTARAANDGFGAITGFCKVGFLRKLPLTQNAASVHIGSSRPSEPLQHHLCGRPEPSSRTAHSGPSAPNWLSAVAARIAAIHDITENR